MKNELDTSLLTKESIQRDIQALEKINTNNTEVINLKRSILGKLNQMNTKIERTGEIKSNKDKKGNKVADLAWVGFGLIMLFLGVVLNNEIMIVVGLSFMFLLGIGFIFSLFTKNTKNNDVSINKNIDLDEIKRLAATDKVQAIKAYRELYNADLAEAKEAVEKMINQ